MKFCNCIALALLFAFPVPSTASGFSNDGQSFSDKLSSLKKPTTLTCAIPQQEMKMISSFGNAVSAKVKDSKLRKLPDPISKLCSTNSTQNVTGHINAVSLASNGRDSDVTLKPKAQSNYWYFGPANNQFSHASATSLSLALTTGSLIFAEDLSTVRCLAEGDSTVLANNNSVNLGIESISRSEVGILRRHQLVLSPASTDRLEFIGKKGEMMKEMSDLVRDSARMSSDTFWLQSSSVAS